MSRMIAYCGLWVATSIIPSWRWALRCGETSCIECGVRSGEAGTSFASAVFGPRSLRLEGCPALKV
jgi:hypothetical protein